MSNGLLLKQNFSFIQNIFDFSSTIWPVCLFYNNKDMDSLKKGCNEKVDNRFIVCSRTLDNIYG